MRITEKIPPKPRKIISSLFPLIEFNIKPNSQNEWLTTLKLVCFQIPDTDKGESTEQTLIQATRKTANKTTAMVSTPEL